MRHLALISGVSMALFAPLTAMAGDSVDLRVTGVISPTSCNVSLGGASEVQLDPVKLGDFTPGEDFVLAEKSASLSIDCQGPAAKFRLKATDAGEGGVSTPGSSHYGLGWNVQGGNKAAPKPNGYFTLSIDTAAMVANNFVLKSTDQGAGQAWASAPATDGKVPFDHDGEAFAFAADSAATEPADLSSLIVPLRIGAVLAKDPKVIVEQPLSGQATIEIMY